MNKERNDLSEGSTYLEDVSGLKLPWVKTQDQLNQVEAENIAIARRKHLIRKRNFLVECISENFF